MRDARSPWSLSGNSYRGHMAWKNSCSEKTASNSPSVRMNFHVVLVLMSPRTMLHRFVLSLSVFLSAYDRGTFIFLFSGQTCVIYASTHWNLFGFGFLMRQTVKRVVKLHVFVFIKLFFFCFAGKFTLTSAASLNFLSPSLFDILFAADIHPLGAPAAGPPQSFLPSSSHPLLLVSYWPFVPPLSPPPLPCRLLSSPSFSHHPLSLQSPTSSWTLLLVSCSWLIIPHGNIFSVDVRELLLLLMKI